MAGPVNSPLSSAESEMVKKRNQRTIRLLLVDDHPLVREGIRSCLSRLKRFEIVGEAVDGCEAVSRARELSPDIVLMDINLPRVNGVEATRLLMKELPRTKVLVLTVHNNREYVLQIVRDGACGYVLKDASPEELAEAIDCVDRGEAFFSPEIVRNALDDFMSGAVQEKHVEEGLSDREREVLAMIAEGISAKGIADRLALSIRTVETHRYRIMKRLKIHSSVGLARFAISHGIVKLG